MKPGPENHDLDFVYDGEDYEEIAMCNKCGATGQELLTWCPGIELNQETLDACFEGNVIDLERWRRERNLPPSPMFEDEVFGQAEGFMDD